MNGKALRVVGKLATSMNLLNYRSKIIFMSNRKRERQGGTL
jgi:hypothetical protein